ncbi:hypothetical protein [Streptomyces sp. NPDC051183]|uniref:WXG100 family type VII secretion target n=1 Tax=Streptomyces sp. NPDC051183 TaxID=3155165 RepID=UPI00344A6702
MVAALDPGTVESRAAQLTSAAATIKEIGEALKTHRVRGWEGEAAQAFRDWAGRAGSATLRLGEYSAAGGEWMSRAGQVMYEVKGAGGVPAYDPATAAALRADVEAARALHDDPEAQRAGREAWSKLTADHGRATAGLKKLAEAYEQSAQQLARAEIPTFPPLPAAFVPAGYAVEVQDAARSTARGGEGGGEGEGGGGAGGSGGTGSDGSGRVVGHRPAADTMPGPRKGLGDVRAPELPDRDAGGVDLAGVGALPGTPVSPAPAATVQTSEVPVSNGGGFTHGGALPGAAAPRGRAGSTPPRDTGIVGGRPVVSGVPSAGIPRGTVVGSEGTQVGGRGTGGGGLQQGVGSHSTTGGRPFTQGGSGLVRGNPGGGAAMGRGGAGAHAPSRRQGPQGGERRPGCPAEDEETWQGSRRVVPPVID